MNMRDKAIDALSIHADHDDLTGTSIALDAALAVTLALIQEAQADAWDEGVREVSDAARKSADGQEQNYYRPKHFGGMRAAAEIGDSLLAGDANPYRSAESEEQ